MKQKITILFVFLLLAALLHAQKNMSGVSKPISVNVTKDPPLLVLVDGSIRFADANGNKQLDAGEQATLYFTLENKGKGVAGGLKAVIALEGVSGLETPKPQALGGLASSAKKEFSIAIKAGMNLQTGKLKIKTKIEEEADFGLDEWIIEVNTQAFIPPNLQVVDFSVSSDLGTQLKKKVPFSLDVLVQNLGQGPAQVTKVNLQIPANVFCLSENLENDLGTLEAGASKKLSFSLVVNDKYPSSELPLQVLLAEKMGKYASNKSIALSLNQAVQNTVVVKTDAKQPGNPTSIQALSLSAEVDKNIPSNPPNMHRYALVIGNEDYSSFQTGLSSESNVPFAMNDAKIFAEYCKATLGVPEKQVKLLINGTSGQMNQALAWLSKLAEVEKGNAELIFYYAGHGLPDEQTQVPFLIPVDVSGAQVQQALRLDSVYAQLGRHKTKRVTVFLDACFSGGARNAGLLADRRAVRRVPKAFLPQQNTVVFASSSGEETSGGMQEKQHGYFTYFLLKKLQESAGNISYKELAEFVNYQVNKASSIQGQPQTPQVIKPTTLGSEWENWRLK